MGGITLQPIHWLIDWCVGYDGVDEFFPALLELIQCKISGTDIPVIPPIPDERCCKAQPSDSDGSAKTAAVCTELNMSPLIAETGGMIMNLGQSPSATKWYYFSSGYCKECVKSPALCNPLERSVSDGQSTLEHAVVTVNGLTEHWCWSQQKRRSLFHNTMIITNQCLWWNQCIFVTLKCALSLQIISCQMCQELMFNT